MAKKLKNSEELGRISFRILDDETARELDKRAKAVGKSRHDFARDLTIAGMTALDEEQHETRMLRREMANVAGEIRSLRKLQEELLQVPENTFPEELMVELHQLATDVRRLKSLRKVIQKLRLDHAAGVNLLAVNAGRLSTEEARQWVIDKLLTKKKGR